MRISEHPILGRMKKYPRVQITFEGKRIEALEGEPIAAAFLANNIRVFRKTPKRQEPRGVFCAIGRCTDCIMEVDGVRNVRTCITPVKSGMTIARQRGLI